MRDAYDYEGYKFEKGSVAKVTDPLTVESPLQININGKSFTVVMQTPGAEKELATGLLHAENVIKDFKIVNWEFERSKEQIINQVNITTPDENLDEGFLSSRSLLSVSSCGICGKREIEDLNISGEKLPNQFVIQPDQIDTLFQTMQQHQKLFDLTGGCHGIAAFDKDLKLLSIHEDVGRHNALDKVIGELILTENLKSAKILTFSGRISYEMVTKAFRAKVPGIAAVSAPTTMAIEMAKEFGITVLAFCRNGKATCYSNPSRINAQLG